MAKNPLKLFKKIPDFFSEVKTEMKKVTWPTKNDTINKTLIVIAIFLLFAAILGGLDAFFAWVVRAVIIK